MEELLPKLRQLLNHDPTKQQWIEILSFLTKHQQHASFSLVMDYVEEHFQTWPKRLLRFDQFDPSHPAWELGKCFEISSSSSQDFLSSKDWSHIQHLSVTKANGLQELELLDWTSLKTLYVKDMFLQKLPELGMCPNLEEVTLEECFVLRDLSSLALCSNLRRIVIRDCYMLGDVSSFYDCHSLEEVVFLNCHNIKSLGWLLGKHKLQHLEMRGCWGLELFPQEEVLSSSSMIAEFQNKIKALQRKSFY